MVIIGYYSTVKKHLKQPLILFYLYKYFTSDLLKHLQTKMEKCSTQGKKKDPQLQTVYTILRSLKVNVCYDNLCSSTQAELS